MRLALVQFLVFIIANLVFATTAFSTSRIISNNNDNDATRFVLLGGTGKIGTAVASHLLLRTRPSSKNNSKNIEIILVGRRNTQKAVDELLTFHHQQQHRLGSNNDNDEEGAATVTIRGIEVADIWSATQSDKADNNHHDHQRLRQVFESADCVIHTAGPFLDRAPSPLQLAVECRVPVYVDVSDPLPFLETSILQHNQTAATTSKTTAILAAGAFPGMSNVLAMEAAAQLLLRRPGARVQNCHFCYYTAGLGGSGALNLYITNLGFGESMVQYDRGELRFFMALSGLLLGTVDFKLPPGTKLPSAAGAPAAATTLCNVFGLEDMERRIGTKQVFSWPFPEAATVPTELRARGSSVACMGTAPDLWNSMLGLLVNLIPRLWWRNKRFSKFLADFSEPLVWLSDRCLAWQDKDDKLGETHAMRVDVTRRDGSGVSILQGHASFRQCVAQSCAEFALDALEHASPGVWLPEQRYRDATARQRILSKLTSTPGTFCYTGPVELDEVKPPSRINEALEQAERDEAKMTQN